MSSLDSVVDKVIETDVLVVDSEGAGATAALEAIKRVVKVTVVTKGSNIAENLDPNLGYYSSCRTGKCTGCAPSWSMEKTGWPAPHQS